MIKKTTLRNKSIGNKETKIIAILTKAIITIVKVAIRRMKLTVVIIMVIVVVSLWICDQYMSLLLLFPCCFRDLSR